jgi:hypothetical protein
MCNRFQISFLALALTVTSLAQAMSPNNIQAPAPEHARVFEPGPNVSSPEIIPASDFSPPPKHCKDEIKGKVVLGAIIDPQGKARNLHFLSPDGTDLDKLALLVADSDHFKPGLRMSLSGPGVPVAIAKAIELQLTGCTISEN